VGDFKPPASGEVSRGKIKVDYKLSVSSKIIFLYGQPLLKPSGNAIVPSENAKNRPEMQKTCQKCNCTVRKCKKPHGNAIVPSGSRKNHPEMQKTIRKCKKPSGNAT
jgi:hypothetical protein